MKIPRKIHAAVVGYMLITNAGIGYAGDGLDDTLHGWGNLKFGMTPKQARAEEPRLDGGIELPNYGTHKMMESNDAPVEIAGRNYALLARFKVNRKDGVMRLQTINLMWDSDPEEAVYKKQCERIFQEHLGLLGAKYGGFDGLNTETPLAVEGVDKKKSRVKQTPDGRASYSENHFTMTGDCVFQALKTFPDSKKITVLGLPTSQGEVTTKCRVKMTFAKDLPDDMPQ